MSLLVSAAAAAPTATWYATIRTAASAVPRQSTTTAIPTTFWSAKLSDNTPTSSFCPATSLYSGTAWLWCAGTAVSLRNCTIPLPTVHAIRRRAFSTSSATIWIWITAANAVPTKQNTAKCIAIPGWRNRATSSSSGASTKTVLRCTASYQFSIAADASRPSSRRSCILAAS